MYSGYLRFGGNLVVNNELTRGYARSFDCPKAWYQAPYCDSLNEALDEQWAYDAYPPSDLPWFDSKLDSQSERFFGVYGLDFSEVLNSTRQVPTVEGITDGGVIGRTRKGMKRFRLRAFLAGYGRDALDYGMAWLNAVIDPDSCGQVSAKCGTAELEWFVDCPPARQIDPPITDEEYEAQVDDVRRFLRFSAAEVGATIVGEYQRGQFFGYEVEVDFVSETPHILGISHTIPLDPASPSVVQDIVYNLMPVPSAELAGPEVVVQTNYSTNPSLETNATGWSAAQTTITGTLTGVRSTPPGDPAAVGQYSFKVNVTATNTSTAGILKGYQDVTLPTYAAGQRFSFSLWGFMTNTGTAVLNNMRFILEWRDAGNAIIGSPITLGTGPVTGGAIPGPNITRPSNAVTARCIMEGHVTSWSTGAVLTMFVDALVVSLP